MNRKDANKKNNQPRRVSRRLKTRLAWAAGAVAVLGLAITIRAMWGPEDASAGSPPQGQATASGGNAAAQGQPATLEIVAIVNGEEIRRGDLAQECLRRFGGEVLESLVNKHLIVHFCKQNNVIISRADVDAEIARIAKKFRLDTMEYLKLLERERGVTAEEYARDIIWPALAMRRLAADRLQVSDQEVRQMYESQYGPAVQARLIAVKDMNLARQIHAQVQAQPNEFARIARKHSTDVNSASAGGLLPPIRRHVGDQKVENLVFSMAPGEISPVVQIGNQYAIFRCEQQIAARNVQFESVRDNLVDSIRDRKIREVAPEVFQKLQQGVKVVNVYNDPQLARQMPGVAATLNGQPIPLADLADECIARYGEVILEGEINRRMLEQRLQKKNLQVTQADIDAEIAHAAEIAGVIDDQGRPDVAQWIEGVTSTEGVTYELYVRDTVWPSAALKKLVQTTVEVTEEDVQKGFDANYGQRVRCRAIVMTNLRRAQEVWEKARQNPSIDFFGDLAEEYSVEASSRARRGEVPPIRKFGGQPLLEKEAFALKPGELSGIIHVGDKFVILMCEGYTEPINVSIGEVKELIVADIHEKKLRIAMAEQFETIYGDSRIDNFLAGTTHSPSKPPAHAAKAAGSKTGNVPAAFQQPAGSPATKR